MLFRSFVICLILSWSNGRPLVREISGRGVHRSIDVHGHVRRGTEPTESLGPLEFLKACYLPKLDTVPAEYGRFRVMMILQDSASYFRGVLSTGAILQGMGVGDASITPLQATLTWIYRDGAGMLGGLIFGALVSFDSNVKSWRFFADTINDVGIAFEMVAVAVPKPLFLPLLCLGTLCRALCGVSAGAANAAISEHWGRRCGNIGDVLAKNSAQVNTSNIIGLLLSVKFAAWANKSNVTMNFPLESSLSQFHTHTSYLT